MHAQLSQRYRVLLVDDHPIVRQGVASLLRQEEDMEICAEAESGPEALEALRTHNPSVIIVDISLRGSDGLELTKAIRGLCKIPILIMSMHDEAIYAERALRAGANGYIMKQEVAHQIVDALRCVIAGDTYVSASVRQSLLREFVRKGRTAASGSIDSLSDRELEVLRLIGEGQGTGQIAEVLNLSPRTIETYRAHIKDKMCISGSSELLRFAIQWVAAESVGHNIL
ncbi:MAG: response regulator transcription factor [Verrucomicrobia bacterium]|nr:response regulator transcription factor [Verrucomicrobiota bacterium]